MTAPSMDDLVKQITDIQTAIAEGRKVPEELTAEMEAKIAGLVDVQVRERLDRVPDRPLGRALIGPDGKALQAGRYTRALKGFAEDGYFREVGMSSKMKPIDLVLTYQLLRSAAEVDREIAGPSADLEAAVKALTPEASGAGAELIDTAMAQQLWEDFYLASRVAGLFETGPMPTNPFEVPLGLGAISWRKGTRRTPTSPSDAATSKVTLTATEQVTEQGWDYTFDEDAIAAWMPGLRRRIAQSGAEQIDAFILNADATATSTGNINSDDAAPASDAYYLTEGQDGLIHQWIVDNTAMGVNAGGDALADADILDALALMGKYAVDPSRLAMVTDVSTYLKGFLSAATGAPGANTITIDKFGAGAVVLTGQLASYRGIPIVVSASHGEAEADGKQSVTAASNTLGRITIPHRDMWMLGFRRQITTEIARDIRSREHFLVTSFRIAVGTWGTRSSNTHTAGIRNILN